MCLLLSAARDPQTHNLDMFITSAGHIFILHKLSLNKVLKRSITSLLEIKSCLWESHKENLWRQSQNFGTPHSITPETPGISYSSGSQCLGFFLLFRTPDNSRGYAIPTEWCEVFWQ